MKHSVCRIGRWTLFWRTVNRSISRIACRTGAESAFYPVFESIDISSLVRLRPIPLHEVRFIADDHLGRLAAYLRMVGFDTLYRDDYEDEELARISSGERRTLLTRDRGR